jgi:hypothetical protein
VPGAEKPGIVRRVTSGWRLNPTSGLRALFEACFFFQIRQNATSPPIRARPTKPPIAAAIVPIFTLDDLGRLVEESLEVAVVDEGVASDLLAMLISKISEVETF